MWFCPSLRDRTCIKRYFTLWYCDLLTRIGSTARFTHVFGFLYGILFYKNIFLFSIRKKNILTIIPCPVCTCTYWVTQYLCISDRKKFNWVPSRAPPRNTTLVNGFSYIVYQKVLKKHCLIKISLLSVDSKYVLFWLMTIYHCMCSFLHSIVYVVSVFPRCEICCIISLVFILQCSHSKGSFKK